MKQMEILLIAFLLRMKFHAKQIFSSSMKLGPAEVGANGATPVCIYLAYWAWGTP